MRRKKRNTSVVAAVEFDGAFDLSGVEVWNPYVVGANGAIASKHY